MNISIINRKTVRNNKSMKIAQKSARKRFGRVRHMWMPKAKINKVVILGNEKLHCLAKQEGTEIGAIPENLQTEDFLEQVRASNLKGLSGNGFNTIEKLERLANSNAQKKYLIVNGVECDPGLVHDSWLLTNRFDLIRKGILTLQKAFSFEKIMIATKENIEKIDSPFPIIKVPNRYPMGHEKMLIRTLLGKEMPKQEIPMDQGILVMNLQTVIALGQIICQGKAFEQRYLTVADLSCGKAEVALVPFKTPAKQVIKTVFGDDNGQKTYVGGGAMDCHEIESDEKVNATTNFIAYGEQPDYDAASPCKGCGGCTSKCPMGIQVHKIVKLADSGATGGWEEYHPENCIGCNACTYTCRAGKNVKMIMAKVNGKI